MEEKRINLVEQNKRAFNFIEELYVESSFLIKEIEHYLKDNFKIGKPSGYQISSPSSTGLASDDKVKSWLLRGFAVFFVDKKKTYPKGSNTVTKINKDLKVIYIKIIFYDKDSESKGMEEPTIYSGVLYDIERLAGSPDGYKKFENIIGHIEKNWNNFFTNIKKNGYNHKHIKVKGKFIENKLFDINNSEEINDKIIKPLLELYKKNNLNEDIN